MTQPLFERPVQTIKAISLVTGIGRTTTLKACQKGRLGECAYRSSDAWLINTQGEHFRQWYTARWQQARVKGRLTREEKEDDAN